MGQDVVYYVPEIESVNKRKHLLFIQKYGFSLHKVTTLNSLKDKVKETKCLAVVVHDENTIKEVASLVDSPIIVLSKEAKSISDIMPNLRIENMVFFRTENDPIDSVLEILRLLSKFSYEERVV